MVQAVCHYCIITPICIHLHIFTSHYLSPEFSMSGIEYFIDGDVVLSTSECIIVDQHQQYSHRNPYLLLSPSGLSKIQAKYGSQLAPTQIEFEEESEETSQPYTHAREPSEHNPHYKQQQQQQQQQHHNHQYLHPTQDEVMERLVSTSKWLFFFTLKVGVAAYILGFRPNQHMKNNWIRYLILFIVGFHMYVMFAPNLAGFAQVRFTYMNNLQDKIVQTVVHRVRDDQYVITDRPRWVMAIYDNFDKIWKDLAIYVLTLIPSMQSKINEAKEEAKRAELGELEEIVLRLYYSDPNPLKNIEQALEEIEHLGDGEVDGDGDGDEQEISNSEIRELKFDLLVEYYQLIKDMNSKDV